MYRLRWRKRLGMGEGRKGGRSREGEAGEKHDSPSCPPRQEQENWPARLSIYLYIYLSSDVSVFLPIPAPIAVHLFCPSIPPVTLSIYFYQSPRASASPTSEWWRPSCGRPSNPHLNIPLTYDFTFSLYLIPFSSVPVYADFFFFSMYQSYLSRTCIPIGLIDKWKFLPYRICIN